VADARTLDQLDHLSQSGDLEQAVIPSASLLPGFPIVRVDQIAEARIRQGREFRSSPFVVTPGAPFVKVISSSGGLIAIGQLKFPNVYHPMIVF
jgi:tRNA pseudouridine55 synthase